MGRKPLPNETKMIRGTFKATRATGELMSELVTVCPPPPENLNDPQKELFLNTAKLLIAEKKLTVANIHYVSMLAVNMEIYNRAVTALNNGELVITTQSGYVQPSPYLGIKNNAEKNLIDLGKLFGFDPYSATKFKQVRKGELNKLQEIIKKAKENKLNGKSGS